MSVRRKIVMSVIVLVSLPLMVLGVLLYMALGTVSPIEAGVQGALETVSHGYVSSYIVELGGGRLALVDVGVSAGGEELVAALKARGKSVEDVDAVLLTHGHIDHVAGLRLFAGKTKIYAHKADWALIEEGTGVQPTDALTDGQKLVLGTRTFEIFHMPGHTAGSVAMWVDNKLLFGDNATASKDGVLQPAPYIFSDDTALNVRSLRELERRIQGRRVDALLFSHSGPLGSTSALTDFVRAHP